MNDIKPVDRLDIIYSIAGTQTLLVENGTPVSTDTTTKVTGAGPTLQFAEKKIASISGGLGADTITVDNPNAATDLATLELYGHLVTGATSPAEDTLAVNLADTFNIKANAAAVKVFGQGGNDTINVSSITGNLAGILGALTIDGGAGTANRLIINDSGGSAHTNVVVTQTKITGLASVDINYLSTGGNFTNGATNDGILIRTANGDNTINVQGTLAGSTTKIQTGTGNDIFNVSSDAPLHAGNLNNVAGDLTIEAGTGLANQLIVSDKTGAANAAITVTNASITGIAGGVIRYVATGGTFTNGATNDGIRILGSDNADTFNVFSTLTGSTTKVEGLAGNDTFNVSSDAPLHAGNLDAILGDLTLDSGAGAANRLIVSDKGGSGNSTVGITATDITGLAPAAMHYASSSGGFFTNGGTNDGILIITDDADHTFNVQGTLAGSTTKIQAGTGKDVFNVSSDAPANAGNLNNVAGALAIEAGTNTNQLVVSDRTGAGNASVTVTKDTITGIADGVIRYVATGGSFNGAANDGILIQGSSSFDVINVQSTLAGSTTRIDGVSGGDTITVGSTQAADFGQLDQIAGKLTAASAQLLYLNDRGTVGALDYDVTPTSVTAAAPRAFAGVFYDGTIGTLRLDGTDDPNVFNVTPSFDTQYYIDGNLPAPGDSASGKDSLLLNVDVKASGARLFRGALFGFADGAGVWTFSNGLEEVRFESIELLNHTDIIVAGAGSGGVPTVEVYGAENGLLQFSLPAYENTFKGGVRVATADVNNDGTPDIIVAPGQGREGLIKIFDGATTKLLKSFKPFGSFSGGLYIAVGDVNADDVVDLVVSEGSGGFPLVRAFNGKTLLSSNPKAIGDTFFAYSSTYRGGVTVAAGDLDNDGKAEIVTGSGTGMITTVGIFTLVGSKFKKVRSFQPFGPGVTAGAFVAVGDVNGDLTGDIIVGAGPGWFPEVRVFSGINLNTQLPLQQIDKFFAFESTYRGGVHVADKADDGEDKTVRILLARGKNSSDRVIRSTIKLTTDLIDAIFTGPDFTQGGFIA